MKNNTKLGVIYRCRFWGVKCSKMFAAGALPQTPLGSLQHSSGLLAGLRGLLLTGGDDKGGKGSRKEGKRSPNKNSPLNHRLCISSL